MWQEAQESFKRLNLPLLAAGMEKGGYLIPGQFL
jgi:hypothetical protein